MAIDTQRLLGSEFGIRLAGGLARLIPQRFGYAAAEFIADRIASRRNSRVVRSVRANQWIAHGEGLQGEALDQTVREAFRNSARSIYELYRGLEHLQEANDSILIDPSAEFIFRRPEFEERGLMLVSLHLGNFDLILHMLSKRGVKPLVLTIPNPRGGRRVEFESREKAGARLLLPGVAAFRKALRHLKLGGMAATGIDRPIPNPRFRPRFFGRPAALPLHYIFLAIKAAVPVVLLTTIRRPDGKHLIFASDPLEMELNPDRETEALQNAERVLRVAEDAIRKAPAQWSESLPVWPDMLDRVPR
jgi:phosphatidylinositol dimannoside acyltransferase